jgi:UDP-N-acetylmuramoyl-L-alanyl-D-glutamate--2,6-diaminopimelate ligase
MKKLKQLLAGIQTIQVIGSMDVEITGVRSDSRKIKKGGLFVAVRGETSDGHQFIGEAVGQGAAVVVCEKILGTFPAVTQIQVKDSREALARISAAYHDRPSEKLKVIGVTGTNGKTTTSYLVASILEAAGLSCGILGTISYKIGGRELPASNTTPGADEIQELLATMVHAGLKAVVMEVSSHALAQRRVENIAWDTGVFTNLTQDHLDYHGTMDSYFESKKLLFTSLGGTGKSVAAVLNAADTRTPAIVKSLSKDVRVLTYSIDGKSELRAESVQPSISGCKFTLVAGMTQTKVSTALCGEHNVYNCLAAAGAAISLGVDFATIQKGIESMKKVPGRLERVSPDGHPFTVFVDYAHTDDALRNVLQTLRPLTGKRLVVVFGCGGNRDPLKRPLMGRAASELADHSIVTTDNPRQEDPEKIMDQVSEGFQGKAFERMVDRREAIGHAIDSAREGDVILIAGKGHESYQEIQGVRHPFDDRQVVRELLEDVGSASGSAGSKGGAWKP